MTLELTVAKLADEVADDLRRSMLTRGIAEHYMELEAEVGRLRGIVDSVQMVLEQLHSDRVTATERDQLRREVADLRAAIAGIDRDIVWEPPLDHDGSERDTLAQALKTALQIITARKQQALR